MLPISHQPGRVTLTVEDAEAGVVEETSESLLVIAARLCGVPAQLLTQAGVSENHQRALPCSVTASALS
jgi:hypothetical protein